MREPRILVFQHMDAGHPGIFRELLRRDGIALQPVRLDLGEPIPDLDAFAALCVMGGPQDVWQEAEHPWLVDEKAAVREAVVGRRMPFLGICLGHQLLAAALGGEVGPAAEPEIGVSEIAPSGGAGGSLLTGMPARLQVLQWHAAEVLRPPAAATVLAGSTRCAVQAMQVGDRALGLQFHAEVTEGLLDEWLAQPANTEALVRHLGADGAARFRTGARAHMASFESAARWIYDRFRALL